MFRLIRSSTAVATATALVLGRPLAALATPGQTRTASPFVGGAALSSAVRFAATATAASASGGGGSSPAAAGAGAAAATGARRKKKKVKKVIKRMVRRPAAAAAGGSGGASALSTTGGAAAGGAVGGNSTSGSGSNTAASAAARQPAKKKLKLLLKKGGGGGGAGAGKAAASDSDSGSSSSSARRRTAARTGSNASAKGGDKSSGGSSGDVKGTTLKGSGGGGGGIGKKKSRKSGAGGKTKSKAAKSKRLSVCVLNSSYDGSDSATAALDNFLCTPEHYMKKDKKRYTFDDVAVKKIDSYRTVRELVTSGKYDVFFNLCDGGMDEKRAGVDVVLALEEMNAAFTGTDSRSFEPSKIDMKLLVGSCGVQVPNFVLLENADSLAKKCRHLRFPVIVKHLSGYASVGIHKDNRCDDLDQLRKKVPAFIAEFNHALVEEFIRGREGTVLACADAASPHGVKVFKPLMFNFLKDGDDFAFFERKWTMTLDDKAYDFLPSTDPAHPAIVEMARNAYKYIMNGVGYGRVDFRIDDRTGEPQFLEINPNCGMWYNEKDGGDFADLMVTADATWDHERFLANAVARALREQAARKPWYFISHDKNGQFSTRASRTVPLGKCLFGDAVHPIPVVTKALYKLGAEDPAVGCVICRADGVSVAVAIRHSCEPNMHFVHGRTLLFAAKRQINSGEELTVDFATLRDEAMPTFACSCGTRDCRSVIFAMPATARNLELSVVKRMLREKKRLWLKQRSADKEAERLLKKRTAAAASSAAAAAAQAAASATTTTTTTTTASTAAAAGGSVATAASDGGGGGGGGGGQQNGSGGGAAGGGSGAASAHGSANSSK